MKAAAPARTVTIAPAEGFKESYQSLAAGAKKVADNMAVFHEYKNQIPPRLLPRGMNDHELDGKLSGIRECHLSGDVLLLYTHEKDVVKLLRCCTHDDLYGGRGKALAKLIKGLT